MLNLLSNAIKFTPDGGRVYVRLSLEEIRQLELENEKQSPHTSTIAQITVSDTGKGISADFLPYVFDRFRQADSTSTRSNKGLGLGLAIARHLVGLHGGTISAHSEGIGQGATFTVKLPIPEHKKEKKEISQQEEISSFGSELLAQACCPASLNGLQVLVVDDEADVREWITTVFTKCGSQVLAVGSVGEALVALEQFIPDVLLSDIGMPDEDGYTLIRKVRELEQNRGGRIAAVALTGYVREEDYRQTLAAGFQLHIAKPIKAGELVTVVASLAKKFGQL
jgi:CheY-like chemotaxis protein